VDPREHQRLRQDVRQIKEFLGVDASTGNEANDSSASPSAATTGSDLQPEQNVSAERWVDPGRESAGGDGVDIKQRGSVRFSLADKVRDVDAVRRQMEDVARAMQQAGIPLSPELEVSGVI
jgi:hypothetical protein